MELRIKTTATRVYLEKADNGIILCELAEDNTISSKIVYEMYFKDGMLDMYSVQEFLYDILHNLNIPVTDIETNANLIIAVTNLDPDKPGPEDEFDDEDVENDNDDE